MEAEDCYLEMKNKVIPSGVYGRFGAASPEAFMNSVRSRAKSALIAFTKEMWKDRGAKRDPKDNACCLIDSLCWRCSRSGGCTHFNAGAEDMKRSRISFHVFQVLGGSTGTSRVDVCRVDDCPYFDFICAGYRDYDVVCLMIASMFSDSDGIDWKFLSSLIDDKGCSVTQLWIDRYNNMVAKIGASDSWKLHLRQSTTSFHGPIGSCAKRYVGKPNGPEQQTAAGEAEGEEE